MVSENAFPQICVVSEIIVQEYTKSNKVTEVQCILVTYYFRVGMVYRRCAGGRESVGGVRMVWNKRTIDGAHGEIDAVFRAGLFQQACDVSLYSTLLDA
jgi:hypothetical protein